MSESQEIRKIIQLLSDTEQKKVEVCVAQITAILEAEPTCGMMAVALVGATVAEQE